MEKAQIVDKVIFYDKRGSFSPLDLKKLDKNWIQSNISTNPTKFTLRGLHYQKSPFEQAKLIKVIKGNILDFVVDLRDGTQPIFFFNLIEGDELFVPRGYAHGFITLDENTIVQYLVDNVYSPENEGVIPWTNYSEIFTEINKIKPEFTISDVVIADKDLIVK
jgi:dTDP-4-dehydrorhamnose 3,5-epimerase